MVSKTEIASRPTTSTSSVLNERCTSTLSMTTWKNSGETSANSCRKKDAISTSPRRCRYLWIAPRNHVMSNRRVSSDNPARRVIRISPPSHTSRSSARVIKAGRDACGGWTKTLSSAALATTMKVPSRNDAMAGKGVLASRVQSVRQARALSPRSLAHRSISGAPIFVRSKAVADLFAVSRNALEVQQRHEGFEARIGWSGGIDFSAHCASPGNFAFTRAVASAMAAGSTADRQSASHLGHRPP